MSHLTYLVRGLRSPSAQGTRAWVSHLPQQCRPVYPKVSECVAKNQLPLKSKEVLRTYRSLQLGLGSVLSFPPRLRLLASTGNEKQEFRGSWSGKTHKHWVMGSLLLLMCIYTL